MDAWKVRTWECVYAFICLSINICMCVHIASQKPPTPTPTHPQSIKQTHTKHQKTQEGFAGAFSGTLAAWVTTPFDVLKTRLQVDAASYRGPWDCAVKVFRKVRATFKYVCI